MSFNAVCAGSQSLGLQLDDLAGPNATSKLPSFQQLSGPEPELWRESERPPLERIPSTIAMRES